MVSFSIYGLDRDPKMLHLIYGSSRFFSLFNFTPERLAAAAAPVSSLAGGDITTAAHLRASKGRLLLKCQVVSKSKHICDKL